MAPVSDCLTATIARFHSLRIDAGEAQLRKIDRIETLNAFAFSITTVPRL